MDVDKMCSELKYLQHLDEELHIQHFSQLNIVSPMDTIDDTTQ